MVKVRTTMTLGAGARGSFALCMSCSCNGWKGDPPIPKPVHGCAPASSGSRALGPIRAIRRGVVTERHVTRRPDCPGGHDPEAIVRVKPPPHFETTFVWILVKELDTDGEYVRGLATACQENPLDGGGEIKWGGVGVLRGE